MKAFYIALFVFISLRPYNVNFFDIDIENCAFDAVESLCNYSLFHFKRTNTRAEDVIDEDTFYIVLSDLDIQSYLFEPGCTGKEMQQREAEAALAMQEDMAGGDHPEPELPRANSNWWCLCLNCPLMPTETEQFRCNELQHGQFLLDAHANTNSANHLCMKVLLLSWTEVCWSPSGY